MSPIDGMTIYDFRYVIGYIILCYIGASALAGPNRENANQKLNTKKRDKKEKKYVSANWKSVYQKLKAQGYSINKISEVIGSEFKNQVYKSYQMSLDSYCRLMSICNFDFPHEFTYRNSPSRFETHEFPQNVKSAEFVGIVMGDGYLGKYLGITLNPEDEPDYVKYVKKEMMELGIEPSIYDVKDSKAIQLRNGQRGVVEGLVDLGLVKGNKTVNQSDVPNWIKHEPEYQKACVKGLFDTDGSIYKRKVGNYEYTNLNFTNRNKSLIRFFGDFCYENDIKGSETTHRYQIQNQDSVRKFLDLVKPEKWKRWKRMSDL